MTYRGAPKTEQAAALLRERRAQGYTAADVEKSYPEYSYANWRLWDEIKVTYRTLDGYESKAYVTEQCFGTDHEGGTSCAHPGTNKHTDEVVLVAATDDGWKEIAP